MIVATDAWTIIPVIAGAATAFGGLVTWFVNGLRAERTRLQTLYADAFFAVISYREFPYMIRCRRAPAPGREEIAGEERLRISETLHSVQESLSNFRAQISTESRKVSVAYDTLVHQTRLTAGGYMKQAWNGSALDNDAGMNILDIGGKGRNVQLDTSLTSPTRSTSTSRCMCVRSRRASGRDTPRSRFWPRSCGSVLSICWRNAGAGARLRPRWL